MIVALKSDGSVWEWGSPVGGTDPYASALPKVVSGLSGIVQLSTRDLESVALDKDGRVWQWGYIAAGTTGGWAGPQVVTGFSGSARVTQVAAGAQFGVARRADGSVWAWGSNNAGELGGGTSGTTSGIPFAVQVLGLSHISSVAAGGNHALALGTDGHVWAWGANDEGQVDVALSYSAGCTCVNHPVEISGLPKVTAVAAGDDTSLVLAASPLAAPTVPNVPVCSSAAGAETFGVPIGRHPGPLTVVDGAGVVLAADAGNVSETTGLPTCAGQVSAIRLVNHSKLWHVTVGAVVFAVEDDHAATRVDVVGGLSGTTNTGYIEVLDERTGKVVHRTVLAGAPRGEVLAAHSHALWIATSTPNAPYVVTRYDSRTGARLATYQYLSADRSTAERLWLDARRGWVIVTQVGSIDVRNAATGTRVRHIAASPTCGATAMGVSEAADRLYMAYPGSSHGDRGRFCIIDLLTGTVDGSVQYPQAEGPFALVVDDPLRRVLVTIGADSPVTVRRTDLLDSHSARLIRSLPVTMGSGIVVSERVVAPSGKRTIRTFTPGSWTVTSTTSLHGDLGWMGYSAMRRSLIVTDTTHGTVVFVSPNAPPQ
jgi:hypothetical protein